MYQLAVFNITPPRAGKRNSPMYFGGFVWVRTPEAVIDDTILESELETHGIVRIPNSNDYAIITFSADELDAVLESTRRPTMTLSLN